MSFNPAAAHFLSLRIDAQTLEIRALEGADNSVGDAPMLPEPMAQIPAAEPVDRVSANGAYDTRACHDAISQRGAESIIPPRKNAQLWKSKSAAAKVHNEAALACKRVGRWIWTV